jgi:hypothetical protein
MNLTEVKVIFLSTSQQGQEDLGTMSVRILLVDDFEPYRKLTVSAFRNEPGFQIVGEALYG